MSISYNDNLKWSNYTSNPNWYKNHEDTTHDIENQFNRSLNDLFSQTLNQPLVRSIQFIRDTARLVLKVPIRSTLTPIILSKNWKQLERAKINAKLTGYSFVQLVSVPVKFLVALIALSISALSFNRAKLLLDKSRNWTANIDGRTSQLEAIKEEGRKNASTRDEYNQYKSWVYSINPSICRK